MDNLVRQSIQDGCGYALIEYMESIGFTHQGGAGLEGESTSRFVRGDQHLWVRYRVEEVKPEHRMHSSRAEETRSEQAKLGEEVRGA